MTIRIFQESLIYLLMVCLLKVITYCSVLEYYLTTVYRSLRRNYQLHIRTCARILCLRLWLFMTPTTANRAIQSFKLVNLDVLRVYSLQEYPLPLQLHLLLCLQYSNTYGVERTVVILSSSGCLFTFTTLKQ